MKYSHMSVVSLTLVFAATVGGCAEFPHVDHVYGHTYAAMVRRQSFNPQAGTAHQGPAPGSGTRLDNVLKAHDHAVSSGVTSHVSTGQFQNGGGG